MSRPKKGAAGQRRSVYLSQASVEIIERNGFQTNLSNFIDSLIRSTSADSPAILAVRYEEVSKKISETESERVKLLNEQTALQAALNFYRSHGNEQEESRQKALRTFVEYINRKGGVKFFIGWITGPGNLHLIRDCGFASVDELVTWAQAEYEKAGGKSR